MSRLAGIAQRFRRRDLPLLPLAIGAVLLVLLAVLAALQYRWIGQVSVMERQRMRASLATAGGHFTEDFDREVTRAFLYFHPEPDVAPAERPGRAVRQYERWLAEVPEPGLVRDLLLVTRSGGELRLAALRPRAHDFEPVAWTADLEPLRRRLADPGPGLPPGPPLAGDVPGLVFPLDLPPWGEPGAPRPSSAAERSAPPAPQARQHLVVRFNTQFLISTVLPALSRRYFGAPAGAGYAVSVVPVDDPRRVLFRSAPDLPAAGAPDLRLVMFRLRPFEELRGLWSGGQRTPGHHPFRGPGAHFRQGAWWLLVKHKNGSLEEAVAGFRRRNLAVSLGIVALVAATSVLMVAATQRAQRLARQQIDFVAGVSHELHTPLTAIRSAGQNLADGVVAEPAQVRLYGALIEREGRRLSDRVAQVLEFAGFHSGRRAYTLRRVDVSELVSGALADSRWLLEERRVRVETEVPADLPAVLADAGALKRALQNLIENAVKYGGREPWVGLRARSLEESGERVVEVAVEDRGPGICREDLPFLFEPFYRGREAAAGTVPGSGLGLSIVRQVVRAHRGRVTVASGGPGRGSAFTLRLPALPQGEPG